MKRSIPVLIFLFSSMVIQSQTYGHEWIQHDQTYLRFYITANNLYRIDQETLDAAITASGFSLASIDPRNIQLFYMGEEQYIFVEGEEDGVFDTDDFIEFYGQRNDGVFDEQLYNNPDDQVHQYSSLFTDTAAYYLTWNTSLDNRRMEVLTNDLTGAPAAETHYEFKTLWVNGSATTINYGGGNFSPGRPYLDIYASTFDVGEGYTDTRFANATRTRSVAATNMYWGADRFQPYLRTAVIATNEVPHHYTISVNSNVLVDTSFTGFNFTRYQFELDTIFGTNPVAFSSLEGSTDFIRHCYIELIYSRIWDFNNASKVGFKLVNSIHPTKYLVVTDFNERSTSPLLYDFDAHTRMVGIIDGTTSKFHMPYDAGGNNVYLCSQDTLDIPYISGLEPVSFVNFGSLANQGDFIILTHNELRADSTGTDWVQAYADYRASPAGGSHDVVIVDIEDLYESYSYGIRKHPLAIRNFAMYAVDSFAVNPENLFIIGKARKYDAARNNTTTYAANYVPTFGNPGSDLLLTARPGTYIPLIPTGRLVAYSGDEVRRYYDKVVEFELAQISGEQTIEDKAWMKNVLHFAGGLNEYEQNLFNAYLTSYGNIIGDTLFGAKVTQFNKITTDPIFYETSDYIDSIINSGVSLITFFGHSTTGSFDYNIGDPDEFSNHGKYNVIFGNGCNTAAIFDGTVTLGEKYINTEGKAAIGFIAATTFSLAGSLNNYGQRFYVELGRENYNQGLGKVIQATSSYLAEFENIYDLLTSMHTTLQGDPSLKLYTHAEPDYVIEEPYVFFEPEIVTTAEDSFTVNVVVTNIGKAVDRNYTVSVIRTKADGSQEEVAQNLRAAMFRDTVALTFFTDAIAGTGLNSFVIEVDKGDSIAELAEWNNIINRTELILGDDAVPIYPYEFALINEPPGYLAASTSNPFAGVNQYITQIDTTQLFNSPLLQSKTIIQSGGVLRWESPAITWLPNKVYYWRVSVDTTADLDDFLWRNSSFLYQPGDEIGWNQSHYFQYLDNAYVNTEVDEDRSFDFVTNFVNYEVATGIYPVTDWTEVTSYVNGENTAVGSCASNGFVVFVIDPVSGYPWEVSEVGDSGFGPFGDIYCSSDPFERIIQFNTNSLESRTTLYNFMMDTVPEGHYFLCYSNNYPKFNEWLDDTLSTGGVSLFDAFTDYGASMITSLSTYDADRSYIFFAKKGDIATALEVIGDTIGNKIDAVVNIPGLWDEGTYTSELIGPARAWDKAYWDYQAFDAAGVDSAFVEFVGVDISGMETVLASGLLSGDTTLNWIDPIAYPYLKLRTYSFDDSLRTPAQLSYWRVVYSPVPEAALNASASFSFIDDTLSQGLPLQMQVAIDNVSKWDMDSLLISYTVKDAANGFHPISYPRQDSLLANGSMISTIEVDTRTLPAGSAVLIVEVNPANDQPEQYHFNNIGYLPFRILGDVSDPLLDVTFDGVHILDGDIVSAKPDILISLKDENAFLALNDTALLDISLRYPDGTENELAFDDVVMRFYPADTASLAEGNVARVELKPVLEQDGLYELLISGQDASGNLVGGGMDYRIGFEVINKPMISNVLTYPNPFTTQTRFVFTLTGSEVPEYFKIQIMTVSGKVIREILGPELGPIHIGNNITTFAWDGTDKFGDPVGNGLYLYRVVAKLNGVGLDNYNTGTDQYFESGIGKMYIAR